MIKALKALSVFTFAVLALAVTHEETCERGEACTGRGLRDLATIVTRGGAPAEWVGVASPGWCRNTNDLRAVTINRRSDGSIVEFDPNPSPALPAMICE
jgi:hypothetical protein